MKEFTLSQDELELLAQEIEKALPKGGVVILSGDLAAGKTTLTQAFAWHLGESSPVTSPTFSLQQCYGKRLFHYDLYNKGLENFMNLGLLEELEKEGYHLIEWGTEALRELMFSAGIPCIQIEIEKHENRRIYRMKNA